MPYFKSEQDVYAHLGRLFRDLLADESFKRQFRKADAIVQWQFRNPRASITLQAPAEGETSVDFGDTKLKPEVILAMDADTAHGFWLGRVNVVTALAAGQIKARGPVAKILRLVPLVAVVAPKYEAQIAAGPEAGETGEAPVDEAAAQADEAVASEAVDPSAGAEAPAEEESEAAPEEESEAAPEAPTEAEVPAPEAPEPPAPEEPEAPAEPDAEPDAPAESERSSDEAVQEDAVDPPPEAEAPPAAD